MRKKLFVLTILTICIVLSVCCFASEITLSGDGNAANPYVITNRQEFDYFAQNYTQFAGKYVSLECDIMLNAADCFELDINGNVTDIVGTLDSWTPIGTASQPFSAYFDGNGHTVFGLYCDASTAGLFGYLRDAQISDLRIYTSYIKAASLGGILCASADGDTIITDVVTSGFVTKNNTNTMAARLSGLVAVLYEDAIVKDCCAYANVVMPKVYVSYAGGLVADNMGAVTDCAFDGSVTTVTSQVSYAGALAAHSTGAILRGYAKGTISAQSFGTQKETYLGGIVGAQQDASVAKCESNVQLLVDNDTVSDSLSVIGGIVGYSQNSEVLNCKSEATILSNATYTGGIVGVNSATNTESVVSDCYNACDITAVKACAGGIAGANIAGVYSTSIAIIQDCFNTGTVDGVSFDLICAFEQETDGADSKINNCLGSTAGNVLEGIVLKKPVGTIGLVDGGVVSADGSGYEYQHLGYGKAMYTSFESDITQEGMHNAVVWFDGDAKHFASIPEYVSVYTVTEFLETQILSYDKINGKLSLYVPSGIGACVVVIAEYEQGLFKTAKFIPVTASEKFIDLDYQQDDGVSFKAFVIQSVQNFKPLGSAAWFE